MKELTQKQQAIWDLCLPVQDGGSGKRAKEVAAILGISEPVVRKTLQACRKKLGLVRGNVGRESKYREVETHPEYTDPDKAAILMDVITDPEIRGKLNPIRQAIQASGLPERFGKALLKRIETRYLNVKTEIRALKTHEILKMIEDKIDHAGQYLDDHALSEASARDLMMGIAQLTEKRQLLRGEPTQIISTTDRKTLHELAPLLLAETQRRQSLTVQGQSERVIEAEPVKVHA